MTISRDPERKRLFRIRPFFEWAALLTTIAARVVAIAGIRVWIDEADDRAEGREARKAEHIARLAEADARKQDLIGRALGIIAEDSSDGLVETRESPLTRWAIEVLAENGLPIAIAADQIRIDQMDLECVTLELTGKEVHVWESRLSNSRLNVLTDRLGFAVSGLSNVQIGSASADRRAVSVDVFGSELKNVRVAPWFAADRTLSGGVSVPSDGFTFETRLTRAQDLDFYYNEKSYKYGIIGPDVEFNFPADACEASEEQFGSTICASAGEDSPPEFGTGPIASTITIPPIESDCAMPESPRPRFSNRTIQAQ